MSGAPLKEPFILPSYSVLLYAHNNITFFAVLLYSISPLHSCRPPFSLFRTPYLVLCFVILPFEHDPVFSVGPVNLLNIVTSLCVTAVQGLRRLL